MNDLDIIARKYGTDKRSNDDGQNIYHNYVEVYDAIFKNSRNYSMNILELGIREGMSHLTWHEYFPNSMIYGVDNCSEIPYEQMKPLENDRIKFFIGDATDKEFLDNSFQDILFDIIIDDASHLGTHQIKTFDILFPKLKLKGIYFIEDLGAYNTFKMVIDHISSGNDKIFEVYGELLAIMRKP